MRRDEDRPPILLNTPHKDQRARNLGRGTRQINGHKPKEQMGIGTQQHTLGY